MSTSNIVILGGGSWGTAIAHLVASKGYRTHIIARDPKLAEHMNMYHENPTYLPGLPIHKSITTHVGTSSFLTNEPKNILATASMVVLSIPCQSLRPILKELRALIPKTCIIINTAKGIEVNTLKTIEQIISDEMPDHLSQYATLSGPSFAKEVVQETPTAVVLGCRNNALGEYLQTSFSTNCFRVYLSTDIKGVELGGAIKNVIAIAAGVSDGLGFGINTRVALITRGLTEISRLGEALGASPLTFTGLSGLGDLLLTCSGELSRNRSMGIRIGKGEPISNILASIGTTEGIQTTYAVYALATKYRIDMPITKIVYSILEGSLSPFDAVNMLMRRQLKNELVDSISQ